MSAMNGFSFFLCKREIFLIKPLKELNEIIFFLVLIVCKLKLSSVNSRKSRNVFLCSESSFMNILAEISLGTLGGGLYSAFLLG